MHKWRRGGQLVTAVTEKRINSNSLKISTGNLYCFPENISYAKDDIRERKMSC